MTAMMSIDALTRRGRRSKGELAAEEARRRWETVRAAVAAQADSLADTAGEQLREARKATEPQVKKVRNRALELADPVAERIRDEVADVSADLSPQVARILLDIKEATRDEAERVMRTLHESAEQAREEARTEERRGRVWALLGWTLFGMAAGALLASEYGKRQRADVALPEITQGQPARDQPMPGQDARAQDARAAEDAAVPVADGGLPTVPTVPQPTR